MPRQIIKFKHVIINGVFEFGGLMYVRTLAERGNNARIVGSESLEPTVYFADDTEVYI